MTKYYRLERAYSLYGLTDDEIRTGFLRLLDEANQEYFDKIHIGIKQKDYEAIREIAHCLKANADLYGMKEVYKICIAIFEYKYENRWFALKMTINKMRKRFQRCKEDFQ